MNAIQPNNKTQTAPLAALVYARVSDKKQEEGSGLQSQEFRGRQRAAERGIPVEMVFLDTVSGGNDLLDRPAVQNLLAFLRSQLGSGKRYVVIFDDHKRFARETEMHLRLRRELRKLGAVIEYLNLTVEDSPEGRFVETMFAAQAQLEREQNARQVRQKTTARLEQGIGPSVHRLDIATLKLRAAAKNWCRMRLQRLCSRKRSTVLRRAGSLRSPS